jgi:hypothetical protein
MHTNNILVPEKSGLSRGISTEDIAFKPTGKIY